MKKGKEKVEDINLMQGIDFKTNQLKIQNNEKTIKNKKFRKQCVIIATVLLVFIGILVFDYHETKNSMESCIEKHSYNYCLSNL